MSKIADLRESLPQIDWGTFDLRTCQRCALCQSRTNVVLPQVVPGSAIMFIGEAPGMTEDIYGEAFTGDSGKLLNQILAEVGIDRSKCSILNTVQCRPPKNREPEKEEIQACWDVVDYHIKLIKPKIIVPLGNVALKRIIPNSGAITKKNGLIFDHKDYPGIKIIPVVHPSFALRDPKNVAALKFGLTRVKSVADGNRFEKLSNVTYIETYEKFDAMVKALSSVPYFSLDIETSGVKWNSSYIISIGFSCCAGESYVLPWIVGNEEFYNACKTQVIENKKRDPITDVKEFCSLFRLDHPKLKWEGTDVKERLQKLLANEQIIKILHNYTFDYKFLEESGLPIKGTIYDTMIMSYILNERKGHGLDDCTLKFVPEYGQYWEGLDKILVQKKKKKDTYAIIPLDLLVPYNGTDADITYQLFIKFYPMLVQEDDGFLPLLNGFLMPLSKLLMETERNGFKADLDLIDKTEKLLTFEINKLETDLKQYGQDINFGSHQQVRKLFFDQLRLPTIKKTEKGEPSTDEEVLEVLQNMHDAPKKLLRYRKLEKLRDTYVVGLRDSVWSDGKLHGNFLIHGTETGRLSSNNPNMQNFPRNPEPGSILYDLNIKIKDFLIVSDPDYVIVETDYSQAELRLIAEYSRDANLYRAFKEERDPHAELAVRLYHKHRIPEIEAGTVRAEDIVTPEQRQKAKTANFSLIYGKEPENFAAENNIPIDEARMIHKVFWETYTGVTAWKQALLAEAYRLGYFKSYFGRKRRMRNLYAVDAYVRAEAEREGINGVIQSQASDYTLYSTIKVVAKCKELGLRVRTLSFVHDSAVYEVHKEDLQIFLTILREIMISPPGVTIIMDCEVKVGTRLGSLKKWKKDAVGVWKEEEKKKVA